VAINPETAIPMPWDPTATTVVAIVIISVRTVIGAVVRAIIGTITVIAIAVIVIVITWTTVTNVNAIPGIRS
jgi:hypothetical protein